MSGELKVSKLDASSLAKEDDLSFKRIWSSIGGRCSALAEVAEGLKSQAGQAFAEGEDSDAKLFRDLSRRVGTMRDAADCDLSLCRIENERRRKAARDQEAATP